jgi:hypothetical protein
MGFIGDFGFENSGLGIGGGLGAGIAQWINSVIWKKRWAPGRSTKESTKEMMDFAFKGEESRDFFRSIFDKRGISRTLDLLLYALYAALLIPVVYTVFVVVNGIAALGLPVTPEFFTSWFVDPMARVVPLFDDYAADLRMSGLKDHIGAVHAAYAVSWLFGPIAIFSGSARLILGRRPLLANVRPGISGGGLLVLGIVTLPALSDLFFLGAGNIVENGSYLSFSLFWAPGLMGGIVSFTLLYVAYFTNLSVRNSTGGNAPAQLR